MKIVTFLSILNVLQVSQCYFFNGELGMGENVRGHPTPTLRLNRCHLIGQSVIFAEMGWLQQRRSVYQYRAYTHAATMTTNQIKRSFDQ